ncbi:MAG: hypothetical protein Q8Q81_16335 [Oxalobacteraceae bacterium]|nr:hypothetical protein [Oxalobacteraceae bacterium]
MHQWPWAFRLHPRLAGSDLQRASHAGVDGVDSAGIDGRQHPIPGCGQAAFPSSDALAELRADRRLYRQRSVKPGWPATLGQAGALQARPTVRH